MSNWGENSSNASAVDNVDGVPSTVASGLAVDPIDVVIDKLLRYGSVIMYGHKSIELGS
jgi:hypothetical protein